MIFQKKNQKIKSKKDMNESFDVEALEREQEEAHRRFQERLAALSGDKKEEEKKERKGEGTEIRVNRHGSITIYPRKEKLDIDIEQSSLSTTPMWWDKMCQIATTRQITKNEALDVLKKIRNLSAERLIALQEVSVPTLPSPGAFYLFDQFEIPNWRDDGYVYDEQYEKISNESMIMERCFLRDDECFFRTCFSLHDAGLWIVQYFDTYENGEDDDEPKENNRLDDDAVVVHDDDDDDDDDDYDGDAVDSLIAAYENIVQDEGDDDISSRAHDTAAQKYVNKMNEMLKIEQKSVTQEEQREELVSSQPPPLPPPTTTTTIMRSLPPSTIRDLTYEEFKKQALARVSSKKLRVEVINARENQVRSVIHRWRSARGDKKKNKEIPSSGLPFLHRGVGRKSEEKRIRYRPEDLKRDRAKATRLFERQEIRANVRTRREVERLRSIVSQSIARNSAAVSLTSSTHDESIFRATGVNVLVRSCRITRSTYYIHHRRQFPFEHYSGTWCS